MGKVPVETFCEKCDSKAFLSVTRAKGRVKVAQYVCSDKDCEFITEIVYDEGYQSESGND